MNKKILILCFALMMLFSFTSIAEYDFEYEDGNPPLAPDLSFPANPSTGYLWTAVSDDPCLDIADHGFYESDPDLMGAGGSHQFRLYGAEAGYAEATFTYARPWEEDPMYTFTYQVMIDEDLNVLIYQIDMQ